VRAKIEENLLRDEHLGQEGSQKAFRNAPRKRKMTPKNHHLAHAAAHDGVQVDPKSAQGPPMATQVHLETAPTFAFNTELLRSEKKPSERAPPTLRRPVRCDL